MPSTWSPVCPAVDPVITRRRFGALLGTIPALAALGVSGQARASQAVHQVRMKQFKFDPVHLTISKGDIVEWINEDFAPHTATELAEGIWDTGELGKNDTSQIAFSKEGTHEYFCVFHPHMKGRIVVS